MVPDGPSFQLYPYGADAAEPPIRVSTMIEVLADERFRPYWIDDHTPELQGTGVRIARPPWTIQGQPVGADRGAPTLFADTQTVLHEVIGLSELEISRLAQAGAIATEGSG